MSARKMEMVTERTKDAEICKVLVFHENTAARHKAEETCARMTERLNGKPVLAYEWWRFDSLAKPVHAQLSMEAAAAADIVVFALHGEDFPTAVINWLENWTERRKKASGLVVLLTTWWGNFLSISDSPTIQLENAARRHGMDFLAETLPSAADVPYVTSLTAGDLAASSGDKLAELA